MIPKSWDEVSLGTFVELRQFNNSELSESGILLEKLIILTNDDIWEDSPISELYRIGAENRWLNTDPPKKVFQELPSAPQWKLKPFRQFTLSEWIRLDRVVVDDSIEELVTLCYRRTKQDEWGNIIYEPMHFDHSERINEFRDMPITHLYGAVLDAAIYRHKVLNDFRDIFQSVDDSEYQETDEDRKLLTPAEIAEVKKSVEIDNRKAKFSWEFLLDTASNGDWSVVDKLLDYPHRAIFNMMAMKKLYA